MTEVTKTQPLEPQAGTPNYRLWGIVAVGAAVIVLSLSLALVAVLAAHKPAANISGLTLATTHQPEHLTELSFNNAQLLPKSVTPGVNKSISYNITNHQGAAVIYHPVVTLYENGQPRTLTQSTNQLADGETTNVNVSFSTARPGTTLELVVSLPDQNQEIHFRSQS